MNAFPTDALAIHRFLMRIGFSAGTIFGWIFIFQYMYLHLFSLRAAFLEVIMLYIIAQDCIVLLTPLCARLVGNGVRTTMLAGVVVGALAFDALAYAFSDMIPGAASLFILAFVILIGLYRALYWIPYSVERALPHTHLRKTAYEILIALIPAFLGVMISLGAISPSGAMMCAALMILSSIVPLLFVRDAYERFTWAYRRSFQELFEGKHGALTLSSFFDGLQGAALLLFWPLAVFLIAGLSYGIFGLVLSITFLLTFLLQDGMRSALTAAGLHRSSYVQAAVVMSSWMMRLVVASPIGVVVVDSYYGIGMPRHVSSMDMHVLDQQADRGSYIDEYTALKEISLALGRIVSCLMGACFLYVLSIPAALVGVFVLAAVSAAASIIFLRADKPAY